VNRRAFGTWVTGGLAVAPRLARAQAPKARPAGFLAAPPTGQGPPVLVLHAWWGLNDTVRAFCQQLASAGFTAFAPDLYRGQVTADVAEAERLSGALFRHLEQPRADLAAAASFLHQQASRPARGLAVIGFSLGAFFALDLSVSDARRVHSVVVYYGTRPGEYTAARASYLGHFAETDPFEPSAEVDALQAALRQAGRPATFHHYPGTGHWFAEADRAQAYDAAAAQRAWQRTLAFLRRAPKA